MRRRHAPAARIAMFRAAHRDPAPSPRVSPSPCLPLSPSAFPPPRSNVPRGTSHPARRPPAPPKLRCSTWNIACPYRRISLRDRPGRHKSTFVTDPCGRAKPDPPRSHRSMTNGGTLTGSGSAEQSRDPPPRAGGRPRVTVYRPGISGRGIPELTASGQSGGAAAPRVRPGLRSLRSPAAAGATGGPLQGAGPQGRGGPSFPPQAGARASPRRDTQSCMSRAPAPRSRGRRGSAAFNVRCPRRPTIRVRPLQPGQPDQTKGR